MQKNFVLIDRLGAVRLDNFILKQGTCTLTIKSRSDPNCKTVLKFKITQKTPNLQAKLDLLRQIVKELNAGTLLIDDFPYTGNRIYYSEPDWGRLNQFFQFAHRRTDET